MAPTGRLSGSGCLSEKMVHIPVNTEYPEDNREVYIFKLDNIPGAKPGSLYHGYWIVLPIDMQWVSRDSGEEFFKARVFTDGSVHIRYPAWPYSLLYDRATMEVLETATLIPERCMVGTDIARNAYLADQPSRKWKNLVLDFPDNHKLSAKDVNKDAGDDDELELNFIEFDGDGNGEDTGRHHFATWIVARAWDGKAPKHGKPDEDGTPKSKAALLKEKMERLRAAATAVGNSMIT